MYNSPPHKKAILLAMTNNQVCLLILFRSAQFIKHRIAHVLASLGCSPPWKGFCLSSSSPSTSRAHHELQQCRRPTTLLHHDTHGLGVGQGLYALALTTWVTKSFGFGGQCTLATHAIHTGLFTATILGCFWGEDEKQTVHLKTAFN